MSPGEGLLGVIGSGLRVGRGRSDGLVGFLGGVLDSLLDDEGLCGESGGVGLRFSNVELSKTTEGQLGHA